MAPPLFNKHGHSIPDPADSYLTDSEINDEIDAILDIPSVDRTDFFNAVRVHHDHQHFTVSPDNVFMQLARDGSIVLRSIDVDTAGITGRDDFIVLH